MYTRSGGVCGPSNSTLARIDRWTKNEPKLDRLFEDSVRHPNRTRSESARRVLPLFDPLPAFDHRRVRLSQLSTSWRSRIRVFEDGLDQYINTSSPSAFRTE
jgi:hypothetical protein